MNIPAYHTLITHLEELRKRIIVCILVVAITTLGSMLFSDVIIEWLIAPVESLQQNVYFFGPAEAFIVKMKVSFFAGLMVSLPVLFVQLWLFISPGLYVHEKRYVLPGACVATCLFGSGVWFCYYWVIPFGLQFLLSFQSESLQPLLSIKEYISFITSLLLSFGVIFNIPLFAGLLTLIGVIDHRMLSRSRKYAIVIIFIVAAVLTPPDVISQLLMAAPLVVLYEVSIAIAWLVRRKKKPLS